MLYENAAVELAPGRRPFLSMPLLPTPFEKIFNRLSKYILRSLVQLESLRHSLNQSHHSLRLIACVFPRLWSLTCIYPEFQLAPCEVNLYLDWPLWLRGFESTTPCKMRFIAPSFFQGFCKVFLHSNVLNYFIVER